MFKTCCGDCGECWYVGNPRTCTCPDETPQRTWVDLTDDEMLMIYRQKHDGKKYSLGRMVQAKLKEKNNG
jgi:hypothetical protein